MSKSLVSWGKYPKYPQTAHIPYWRSELPDELTKITGEYDFTLPFGNGRSYGDSCLSVSDNVLYMRALNRFISADWERGIVVAEAGVTLGELLELIVPHGWFLAVTPGTKYVTLGGAVANDVHGKNHHIRGTFGCYVNRLSLVRSDMLPAICSHVENPELFSATVGGLGIIGLIEWVELQLIPITSSLMITNTIRFDSLKEFLFLTNEFDSSHEYTVAWIDCLAKGASVGRGVFMVGDHSISGDLITNNPRIKLMVPFTPFVSTINKLSLRVFNSIYYHAHKARLHESSCNFESFFYPLDRILNWNRLYGPKGFQQYQCVIPDENSDIAISEILESTAVFGKGSFLAVMKKCGDIVSPGLLSFPLSGVSLALDFPQDSGLLKLFQRLDNIVRQAGGRLYPAKDAHMTSHDFKIFYPNWELLQKFRDPVLCSRFWRRVTK